MAVARVDKKNEKPTTAAPAPKRRITFKLIVPEAEQVVLAASFNGWDNGGTMLKRDAKGVWKTQVSLDPGRYEYRFRVDGHWRDDPPCPTPIPHSSSSQKCAIHTCYLLPQQSAFPPQP